MSSQKLATDSPIVELNHIGIAVQNGNQDLRRLFQVLGLAFTHSEKVEEQGVDVHFFQSPGLQGPHLELLEVLDPEGTVAQFLKKRGPGIHHLSFLVQKGSLDSLCQKLQKENFKLIYTEPKKGAQNMRIQFLHPATAGGVLIELMEPQS